MAVLQEEGVIIQHWPQYVEVGHERAWELLEWDVRNGLVFFGGGMGWSRVWGWCIV